MDFFFIIKGKNEYWIPEKRLWKLLNIKKLNSDLRIVPISDAPLLKLYFVH